MTVLLIGAGFLINPWALGLLFSPKGYLVDATKFVVLAADLAFITTGLTLYFFPGVCFRVAVLCASIGIAWIPLEGVAYLILKKTKPVEAQQTCTGCPFLETDEELAFRARKNATISILGKIDSDVVYDATYSINDQGFRKTPQAANAKSERHLVFLGCSYTFGESVNDNQTLPYYVTQKFPGSKTYNFGIPGYGPQQALHILRSPLADSIQPREGAAFYTFIDHHVNRAMGMMNVFNTWATKFPYYTADPNGEMAYQGNFFDARPVQSYLFSKLKHSYFFSLLDMPPLALVNSGAAKSLGIDGVTTTFQIIEAAGDAYLKKFPQGKFYVVVFPGETRYADKIKEYFAGKPLTVLDYSSNFDPKKTDRMIRGNPHPVPNVYEEVATLIQKDLHPPRATATTR